MSDLAAGARQDNVGRGIFFALVAILIFSSQDAMSKFLVQSVSPFQMTMMRFWAFGAFSLFLALRKGSLTAALRTRQPLWQVLRGLLLITDIWMYVLSLRTVPLAAVQSITLVYPLLVTLFAIPLLGEKVGVFRLVAVTVGFLGALIIVGFMSITCFELVRDAVGRLAATRPAPLLTDLQLAVLLATLAINVAVAWYENRRGRELGSDLLIADAAHTRADVFITVGVLVGLLFSRNGLWWVDPALAIVIAVFIVRIAYRIFQRAVPVLVDASAIPTGTIRTLAESVAGVRGAYSIRSRGGDESSIRYAEVTIAVDGSANVAAAHAIADQVEERLKQDLKLAEVTVHVEPW